MPLVVCFNAAELVSLIELIPLLPTETHRKLKKRAEDSRGPDDLGQE